MTTITSLRSQVAALVAAAQPRPGRPYKLTTSENRQELDRLVGLVDLMFASAAALARLEEWAVWQPGFAPMGEPTVWSEPGAADVRMSTQDPRLASLAEASLTHSPDAIAARLGTLCAMYERSGEHDPAIDAAVADVASRLATFTANGATVSPFYEKFLTPIVGISPAVNPATKEEPPCP
jgi:hypothetical protein